jgi:hypothetical protein
MARHRVRLIATGGAVVFLLGVAVVSRIFASTPDDTAAVAAEAQLALHLESGECVDSVDPAYPPFDATSVDSAAGRLGGSGRIGRAFVGTLDQVTADFHAQVVASGQSTTWIMSIDPASGSRTLRELAMRVLPSGRTAWLSGHILQTAPCGS